MSNHDPIRAALEQLVGAAERVARTDPIGAWWWLSDAIDAARSALGALPAMEGPAVPHQGGREPAAVVSDSGTAAMRRLVEGLMDERGYVHLRQPSTLAPPPAEGEAGDLVQWLERMARAGMGGLDELNAARTATLLQQQATDLAAWRSRAALVPVPVGERPWERPGWCDDEGQCWLMEQTRSGDLIADRWVLAEPDLAKRPVLCLPHWAIAQPSQEGGEVEG